MSRQDSSKRVPKSLDTGTKLVGSFTLTDIAVAALPGVLVVLAIQVFAPPDLTIGGSRVQSLTVPMAVPAIGLGALLVYLTPSYVTPIEWLLLMLGFRVQSGELPHEEARTATLVEQVHPDHDAIERADGAFVGLVSVIPPPMALATQAEWETAATGFEDFLNTTVDFPIQLYATTRRFPVAAYLDHFTDRLSDPDVRGNPRLARLIEEYRDWYAADLERRRMTIREHYVVVPVRPCEVRFENESIAQRLARLPLVGLFITVWLSPRVEEERAAMFDALDERVRRVERGLREIEGVETRRVDATAAAELLAEFWTGEDVDYEDPERVLHDRPIVRGPDRTDAGAASNAAAWRDEPRQATGPEPEVRADR